MQLHVLIRSRLFLFLGVLAVSLPLALLWTAKRIATGEAKRIPEVVDFDPVGLDMAMWF